MWYVGLGAQFRRPIRSPQTVRRKGLQRWSGTAEIEAGVETGIETRIDDAGRIRRLCEERLGMDLNHEAGAGLASKGQCSHNDKPA